MRPKFAPRSCFAALVVGILSTILGPVEAGIVNAHSASLNDVSSAVASAVDGDIVMIPAGTASWTQTLTVTKRISIIGATAVAGDYDHQPMAATDLTVIQDNIVLTGNAVGKIIEATISPASSPVHVFRVSGITFQVGTETAHPGDGSAAIALLSSSTQTAAADHIRIDHCNFDRLRQKAFFINGWCYPVIDHCIYNTKTTGNVFFASVQFPTWGGNTQVIGNGSWAEPSYWGSEKFVFFEDNTINNNATAITSGCIDNGNGGRYVFRKNIMKNTWPYTHGTETGGYRGGRAIEVYENDFNYPTVTLASSLRRSGTSLAWGNVITATNYGNHFINCTVYRENGSGWLVGDANGANIWDKNDTSDQTGNGYGGSTRGLYASGTATTGSGLKKLVVSGTPWTSKDWTGYMATNLDQVDPKGFHPSSFPITQSSGNTMTFSTNGSSTDLNFQVGNRYEIRKVLVALDQPGRGVSDMCSGESVGNFHNVTTGIDGWPHNALEPVYVWNNSLNGTMNHSTATVGGAGSTSVFENRDYYNFNTSWSPGKALTTGIASGLLANRPTQCTPGTDVATNGSGPGVGYWATDEQRLYVCTAPNTWSLYYTPYVYPHPLVSGVPAAPAAPANLRIVP
jgi:hypothetical protein